MKLCSVTLLVLVSGLACRGSSGGAVERRGNGGGVHDPGPAPNGEYGNDPGAADAGHDLAPAEEEEVDAGAAPDDAGGGVVPLPLEEVPARIAQLTCRRRLDCCQPGERSGLPEELAACEQELGEQLGPFFESYAREVGAGRAGYDGVVAADCLTALESAPCDEARTWEPLLAGGRCQFVVPTLADGEDCRTSYECIDGFCQGPGADRDGRCVSPRLADGQPCERGEDCASGTCHPALDVCAAPEPGNICD
jgi:hypothetical protein